MDATASSTWRVICVSISPGAAPLWVIVTDTAGKVTSGKFFTARPK